MRNKTIVIKARTSIDKETQDIITLKVLRQLQGDADLKSWYEIAEAQLGNFALAI